MYCLCVVYVCVLLWDMCSTVMCLSVMVMCLADDVLFVVIVAVKVFMVQLLSPRQISLSGTIKYRIVSYRIVSYRIVSYRMMVNDCCTMNTLMFNCDLEGCSGCVSASVMSLS